MEEKPIIALLYDFDKTLCTTDMQNYSFIPNLGVTPAEFWGKAGEVSSKYGVERILSYMYVMIDECKKKGVKLTREYLQSLGKDIVYYPGVKTWFKRINEYGEKEGVQIEHYIISSGTKEIIEGCEIFKEFKAAYGCEFMYAEDTKEAVWPSLSINYTAKTQFYYRIAKGVLAQNDDTKLNEKTIGRKRVPYSNMIYFGDGMTDIPCMILAKDNGGTSIAVYQEGQKNKVSNLYEEDRVNFISLADYSEGSDLENVVKLVIQRIAVTNKLKEKENQLINK
ncbi:MAG: haloacid dehalogenase-like hydrolase [Bacilli bacterium]|nr:haloacid dehalogenase-like hydrolase [Bacilli bacterium]